MIAEPRMTQMEAAEVRRRLVMFWPQPELDEGGLVLLTQAVLDTGLSRDEALVALRHLMQENHSFRPTVGALKEAGTPPPPPPRYFQPFAELPAVPPANPEEAKAALAAARGVLGADMELARAAKAERDARREGLAIGPADRYKRLAPALEELTSGVADA